jgi:hypothetical protein
MQSLNTSTLTDCLNSMSQILKNASGVIFLVWSCLVNSFIAASYGESLLGLALREALSF